MLRLIHETPTDAKGLRLDAIVSDDLPDDLWIDFHVQHPLADTHLPSNHMWFTSEHDADLAARSGTVGFNAFTAISSPSVLAAEQTKRKHYALLTAIGQTMAASGLLPKGARFLPVVVTHLGEFGHGLFALVERFARNAQRSPALSPYTTGLSTKATGVAMRKRAKDAFACAIAKGWGRPLAIAGSSYC